jgi:hypothetical protein
MAARKRKAKQDPRAAERERFAKAQATAAKRRAANMQRRREIRDSDALAEDIRQEMVTDLRRVYDHPDNPYRGFAASRKRYRAIGHWPEVLVSDLFGTHEEFLRAAGLKDSRTTHKSNLRGAQIHSAYAVSQYAKAHVLPWRERYAKAEGRKHLEVLVASDLHSAFVDPFALQVFFDCLRIVSPDVVVLNGDVFDFPQISRHPKLPGAFNLNIQQEIDYARNRILRPVREACPDAEVLFVIGNHEHRFVRYLADAAPELACLESMDFAKLFGLDEYEIRLAVRSSFMAPTGSMKRRELAENWHVIGGSYVVTHGTYCGKHSASRQMERFQMSGTSGHVHRPSIASGNSLRTGPITWMATPMMASHAVGKDYVPEPSQWQMGFGHASISTQTGNVSQSLVLVHDEVAWFAGHEFRATQVALKDRAKLLEVHV